MESPAQLNFKALARSVQSGKCILVLGRGASTSVNTGGLETPIHLMLARQLWERLGERNEDIDPDDLRNVSQVLYDETGEQTDLQFQVGEFYKQFAETTTELHRNIAALPFQLCLTTSSDDFLFNAFKEAGKKPVREYYDFRTSRDAQINAPTVESPLVYHLYGYREPPESQVITESDLIDFLTRVVKNDPPLPSYIRATLSKKESACLFIDLEFRQWYLRVLMHVLGYQDQHVNRSWAVEGSDFFAKSKQHQSIAYFSSRKTINFHNESLNEFVKRLCTAYQEMAGKETPRSTEKPGRDAPMAFLSYASEDRTLVDDLHAKLENAGIRVWQDSDALRGGDNWETRLTHVIGRLADYVIVVQTPNMVSRIKGVFNTEIDEALKMQRNMPRFRFVIPVHTAENCLMLQFEQEKLHTVPVRTSEDVVRLTTTILDDWKARTDLHAAAARAG
jgi:hypothetical protein